MCSLCHKEIVGVLRAHEKGVEFHLDCAKELDKLREQYSVFIDGINLGIKIFLPHFNLGG